jgi:hypothetical protein
MALLSVYVCVPLPLIVNGLSVSVCHSKVSRFPCRPFHIGGKYAINSPQNVLHIFANSFQIKIYLLLDNVSVGFEVTGEWNKL